MFLLPFDNDTPWWCNIVEYYFTNIDIERIDDILVLDNARTVYGKSIISFCNVEDATVFVLKWS